MCRMIVLKCNPIQQWSEEALKIKTVRVLVGFIAFWKSVMKSDEADVVFLHS